MAMLYDGCDCDRRPRPSLNREQAIWQCDECFTIYQINGGEWAMIQKAPGAAQSLAKARLF